MWVQACGVSAKTITVVLAACAPKIISYILEQVVVGMLLFTRRQVNRDG